MKDCKYPKHHTLLLHRFEKTRSEKDCSVLCAATESTMKLVRPCFMTISAKIRCEEKEVTSYAFLDSGFQRTFLQESLAKRLNIRGEKPTVSIRTLSSRSFEEVIDSQAVTIKVVGLHEDENRGVELKDVLTVPRLPMKATPLPTSEEICNTKHLSGIRFTELQDKSDGLLTGLDFAFVFRPIERRHGLKGSLDAIRTTFGWVMFGSVSSSCLPEEFDPLDYPCMNEEQKR